MFLAIVGTRCSGKSEILAYYASVHGFIPVHLKGNQPALVTSSDISAASSPSSVENVTPQQASSSQDRSSFLSTSDLLKYVTSNWQQHFVTVDLCTRDLIKPFLRRPFFMLLGVDAPLITRFSRSGESSLEMFVQDHDRRMFGLSSSKVSEQDTSCLVLLNDLVRVNIFNFFPTLSGLHQHLESLDLLDPEKLRPGWDAYFMTLASLASQRSNCMKRRVGAVLVREHRVVSTGYNGTPRGIRNCNEGGCLICNATFVKTEMSIECVCLHAEENALLEAGRERVGTNAVLYCNTCPCLRCTIKIIQTGVKTVVYNMTYKVDEMSASLFRGAGVELRRYSPPKEFKPFLGDHHPD